MTITCLWCWVNAHQCRHDQWVQLGANDRASVDAVWSHLFHCFQHGWSLTWAQLPTRLPPQRPKGKPLYSAWPGFERNDWDGAWKYILQTVEIAKAALFGSCACNMSFWIQNPKPHLTSSYRGGREGMKRQNQKKNKKGREINKRRSSHLRTFPKSAEKQGHSVIQHLTAAHMQKKSSVGLLWRQAIQCKKHLNWRGKTTLPDPILIWGSGIPVEAYNL